MLDYWSCWLIAQTVWPHPSSQPITWSYTDTSSIHKPPTKRLTMPKWSFRQYWNEWPQDSEHQPTFSLVNSWHSVEEIDTPGRAHHSMVITGKHHDINCSLLFDHSSINYTPIWIISALLCTFTQNKRPKKFGNVCTNAPNTVEPRDRCTDRHSGHR